jgi:hypothetical protein
MALNPPASGGKSKMRAVYRILPVLNYARCYRLSSGLDKCKSAWRWRSLEKYSSSLAFWRPKLSVRLHRHYGSYVVAWGGPGREGRGAA